ncbi:MAG: tRNA-dihydrouridine synthase [Clostridium sp.]
MAKRRATIATAVAVHGRTREQYYSGKADWEIIAKVKIRCQFRSLKWRYFYAGG